MQKMTTRATALLCRAKRKPTRTSTALIAASTLLALSAAPVTAATLNTAVGETLTITEPLTIDAPSNSLGTVNASTTDLANISTFTNGGSLTSASFFNTGTLINSGDANVGSFVNRGGRVDNDGTLEVVSSSLIISGGGTLDNDGTLTADNLFLETFFGPGTLDNDGVVNSAGTISVGQNSTITGNGTVNANSLSVLGTTDGGTFKVSGFVGGAGTIDSNLDMIGTAAFGGSTTLAGTTRALGAIEVFQQGTPVRNTGTLSTVAVDLSEGVPASGPRLQINADATLQNDGTFNNAGLTDLRGTLENAGVININAGSMISGTGTLIQSDGVLNVNGTLRDTVLLLNGGTLTGSGVVETAVTVDTATIAAGNSAGLLSFGSDLDLTGLTTLEFELGGFLPGAEYDQIDVLGTATLGAMTVFDIDLIGGFRPTDGSFFDLLVADDIVDLSVSGVAFDFGAIFGIDWAASIITLGDGHEAYRLVSNTVAAVPLPAGLPLLLVASAGLFGLRRRAQRSAAPVRRHTSGAPLKC